MTFSALVSSLEDVLVMFREIISCFPAPILLVAATGFGLLIIFSILKWITG